MSTTFQGAKVLTTGSVMQPILSLASSQDSDEVSRFATMCFASHSSFFPAAVAPGQSVPAFAKALDDSTIAPYPLIALANITLAPAGALAAVPHLARIAQELRPNSDEATVARVFAILRNVLHDAKALAALTDAAAITALVDAAMPLTATEHMAGAFEILAALAGSDAARDILLAAGAVPAVESRLLDPAAAGSAVRAVLVQLLARLS